MSFYQELKTAKAAAIGTIMPFTGNISDIPDGWIPCDGSTVGASDFPLLARAIGDTYNLSTAVTQGLINLFTNNASTETGRNPGTYVYSPLDGNGGGATFAIVVADAGTQAGGAPNGVGGPVTITRLTQGINYQVGDNLTVPSGQSGGGTDIIITVSSVETGSVSTFAGEFPNYIGEIVLPNLLNKPIVDLETNYFGSGSVLPAANMPAFHDPVTVAEVVPYIGANADSGVPQTFNDVTTDVVFELNERTTFPTGGDDDAAHPHLLGDPRGGHRRQRRAAAHAQDARRAPRPQLRRVQRHARAVRGGGARRRGPPRLADGAAVALGGGERRVVPHAPLRQDLRRARLRAPPRADRPARRRRAAHHRARDCRRRRRLPARERARAQLLGAHLRRRRVRQRDGVRRRGGRQPGVPLADLLDDRPRVHPHPRDAPHRLEHAAVPPVAARANHEDHQDRHGRALAEGAGAAVAGGGAARASRAGRRVGRARRVGRRDGGVGVGSVHGVPDGVGLARGHGAGVRHPDGAVPRQDVCTRDVLRQVLPVRAPGARPLRGHAHDHHVTLHVSCC